MADPKDLAQSTLDTLNRLERNLDQQLEDTEFEDQETLAAYGEVMQQNHQISADFQQAHRRNHLRQIKANPHFVAKLRSRGLTPLQFVTLQEGQPELYGQVYNQGEDDYLDMLQGKSPKSRGAEQPKAAPGNLSKAQSDALKVRAKEGDGTDQTTKDFWKIAIPDNDPFLR